MIMYGFDVYALMTSLSIRSSFMGFVGAVFVSACIVVVADINILTEFQRFLSILTMAS